MTFPSALARHRYILQICFVALATTSCVLIADALTFRSPINLVWMMGLPVAVGMVANVGWDRRCFMAMALLGISLFVGTFVGTFVGANFTSYG